MFKRTWPGIFDSGDCEDLKRVAVDPNLAGQRQQRVELRKGRPTTGLFFVSSPDDYTALSSGTDGLSERAAQILNDAGVSGVNPTHVETKIAARMRADEISFGVLVINNTFVCGGPDAPAVGSAGHS